MAIRAMCKYFTLLTEQVAFNKLKELITSAPVLIFLDNSHPCCIEADSSDVATGAILSQQTSSENGGKWHPIAFFSKSLSPIKQNYEIHNKEMLAIIHMLEEWQHYLEGTQCQFEVWTDHKNLEYFRPKCSRVCPSENYLHSLL